MFRPNPQHKRILNWLDDGQWHCGNEMTFMVDLRKRISEMVAGGLNIEGQRCKLHRTHDSGVYMRRLIKKVPKYRYEQTPTGVREIKIV